MGKTRVTLKLRLEGNPLEGLLRTCFRADALGHQDGLSVRFALPNTSETEKVPYRMVTEAVRGQFKPSVQGDIYAMLVDRWTPEEHRELPLTEVTAALVAWPREDRKNYIASG